MLKAVVVATAALAIAGSSIVYAQQRLAGSGEYGDGTVRFEHYRPSVDDIKAFTEARIAALKAGLQLTPDQEKNWPPFEQAVRDLAKLHLQRVQRRQERQAGDEQQTPANPFERLERRADAMSQFGTALKHLGDTGSPLYQSLSEAQQHRFRILAKMLRRHHRMGGWFGRGRDHFGRDDREDEPGRSHAERGGDGAMQGTIGPERDYAEPRGMLGRDRGEDSEDL